MAPLLLLLLGLTARGCASAQDNISEEIVPAPAASPSKKVYGWGDSCEDECSEETATVCYKKKCDCANDHPVLINNKFCVKPVLLGHRCMHADQCVYHDAHAICREYSENYTTCVCSDQYVIKSLEGLHLPKLCFPNLSALQPDVPTLLGLGLGMSVFSLLICLVLKIFARARFVRPRRYADAGIDPPLTVSGDGSSIGNGSVRRDGKWYARRQSYPQRRASAITRLSSPQRVSLQTLRVIPEPGAGGRHLSTHILATRMGSAPIAISAETYAAYTLAAQRSRTSSPAGHHPRRSSSRTSITSRSSLPSSRRPSYTQRPNSRPSSRSGSRRPSGASLRSTLMEVPQGRVDHYIYMRTPVYGHPSVGSDDDKSPRTPRSSDQLLAVYRNVPPEHSVVDMTGAIAASSYTTTSTSLGGGMSSYTLGTPSIEDVFQEEDEEGLEQEKEEEVEKEEEENTEEDVKEDPEAKLIV